MEIPEGFEHLAHQFMPSIISKEGLHEAIRRRLEGKAITTEPKLKDFIRLMRLTTLYGRNEIADAVNCHRGWFKHWLRSTYREVHDCLGYANTDRVYERVRDWVNRHLKEETPVPPPADRVMMVDWADGKRDAVANGSRQVFVPVDLKLASLAEFIQGEGVIEGKPEIAMFTLRGSPIHITMTWGEYAKLTNYNPETDVIAMHRS